MKPRACLLLIVLVASVVLAGGAPQGTTKKAADSFDGRVINLAKQVVKAGKGTVHLTLDLPKGYHFAADAPAQYDWRSAQAKVVKFSRLPKSYNFKGYHFPVEIPFVAAAGSTELTFDATAFFCINKSTLCQMESLRIKVPVEVSAEGRSIVNVSATIEPPEKMEF